MPERNDLDQAIGLLRAIHGEYEEALNDILLHVAHLETMERSYEQSHRLSYAVGRDGIVR